jgi:chitin disaccharide deacetylase
MKDITTCLIIIGLLNTTGMAFGQKQASIAEKLGYPTDSKLLIIHADDMGMSHSTNIACMKAFMQQSINSGSVMVPCPWFPEMAAFLKEHPEIDAGIHLTFTSEWKYYKWGGVLSSCDIPSLLDSNGYFQSDNGILMRNAKVDEVVKEVKAQIDKAIEFGIKPTHIDIHTGSLLGNPVLLKQVIMIAKEYGLPLTIPMNMIKLRVPQLLNEIPPDVVTVDNYLSMYGEIAGDNWESTYTKMIEDLQPGLNEVIFHLSYDDEEMKAIAVGHEEFGSKWRQKDLDFDSAAFPSLNFYQSAQLKQDFSNRRRC